MVIVTNTTSYTSIQPSAATQLTTSDVLLENVIECCGLILTNQDDKVPVEFHGIELYSCHKQNANGHGRMDGKEGNILYSLDKKK